MGILPNIYNKTTENNLEYYINPIISCINRVLIKILDIQNPKYRTIHGCSTGILTVEGIYYDIFGGYGFESLLKPSEKKTLEMYNINTSDLDIKILFSKNLNRNDLYINIINQISIGVKKYFGNDYKFKKIRMGRLTNGFASKFVDVLVGDLKDYTYFIDFIKSNKFEEENYVKEFCLYSALHMFMIVYKLKYIDKTECGNDTKRLMKIEKIVGRLCIWFKISITDRTSLNIDEKMHYEILKRMQNEYNIYFEQIVQILGIKTEQMLIKPTNLTSLLSQNKVSFLPSINTINITRGGYDSDSEFEKGTCTVLNYEEEREIFGKKEYEEEEDVLQNGNGVKSKENYPLYKSTIFILSGFVLLFSTLSTS